MSAWLFIYGHWQAYMTLIIVVGKQTIPMSDGYGIYLRERTH